MTTTVHVSGAAVLHEKEYILSALTTQTWHYQIIELTRFGSGLLELTVDVPYGDLYSYRDLRCVLCAA